ncbi:hypothetical protein AC244_33205 [Ensifer adhaerens]|uniref:Uncharacterized protein n=1 Tax=Ensifer adhaerens TaxID=106592 RepID=A0A0L8BDZ9_ENSAD|nr:hypothetical protein [Ensifer adhaerens]KOF12867.1 hypothetical protein AC244_33205 [Ensifer adhaerens]
MPVISSIETVRIGLGGGAVDGADLSAFGLEVRIGLPREPQPEAMRLKVRLFFEKRPSERCEMRSTRLRFSASRARSLWLHWLIGSPFCAGGSQAKAMIEQICSGVKGRRRAGTRRIRQPFAHRRARPAGEPALAPAADRLAPHAKPLCRLADPHTQGIDLSWGFFEGRRE